MRISVLFCLVFVSKITFSQFTTCHPATNDYCCQYFLTYTGTDMCNDNDWILQFEDNFEGNSLDMGKWRYPYQGVLAGFDFSGAKTWYANTGTTPSKPVSNNVKVENGKLKLIALKESTPINGTYVTNWSTVPPTTASSSFNYSSGWVESRKNLGYGWYEISCKIPKGKGMWPAFWLVNGSTGYTYEIDIFEFWNEGNCSNGYDPNRLSMNPHQNVLSDKMTNPTSSCPTEIYNHCFSDWPSTGYDNGFHKFALEWDFFKLVWYIDGIPVRTAYRYMDASAGQYLDCNSVNIESAAQMAKFWPQTDNMTVIFNLGVQQNNGNEPDASTVFPKEFEIEYFRYYMRKGQCSPNVVITSDTILNNVMSDVRYNTFSAQNVTISGSATSPTVVNNTEQLDIIVANEIVLDPGFEVENGANFVAYVDPGYCVIYPAITINNEHVYEEQTENYKSEIDTFALGNLENQEEFLDEQDYSLEINPNPVLQGNDLIIKTVHAQNVVFSNSHGMKVKTISLEPGQNNLNVSDLHTGVYYLYFELSNKVIKLIVL